MRSRGIWSSLLAAAVVTIGAGREAAAQSVWVETVDWIPTSSVVTAPLIPTATYIGPSYVSPTVYATTYVDGPVLAPTSYVATSSYVVPTYYETRFRRSLFGRRLIPTGTRAVYATSYFPTTLYYPSAYVLPTTYLAPTVVDGGVVATAYLTSTGACCGDAVLAPTTTTRIIESAPAAVSAPAPRRAEPARPAPRAESGDDYDDEPALSSEVQDVPPPTSKPREAPAPVRSTPKAVAPPAESSPPPPQPVEREKSTAPPEGSSPAPAPKVDDAPAPLLPADDLLPAPADGLGMTSRREVRKPSAYDAVDRARLNILFGRVRERDTGDAEEGVRVILTNRGGAYDDRSTMSDAFGRFAVRVPDGDWTVRVAMPSGRVYPVSEITVSNGLIIDSEGRDVPSLTITR